MPVRYQHRCLVNRHQHRRLRRREVVLAVIGGGTSGIIVVGALMRISVEGAECVIFKYNQGKDIVPCLVISDAVVVMVALPLLPHALLIVAVPPTLVLAKPAPMVVEEVARGRKLPPPLLPA